MNFLWDQNNKLKFEVYLKPGQRLKYLNKGSTHQRSCFEAITTGVLVAFYCSNYWITGNYFTIFNFLVIFEFLRLLSLDTYADHFSEVWKHRRFRKFRKFRKYQIIILDRIPSSLAWVSPAQQAKNNTNARGNKYLKQSNAIPEC